MGKIHDVCRFGQAGGQFAPQQSGRLSLNSTSLNLLSRKQLHKY
jgi:hypothetical protein